MGATAYGGPGMMGQIREMSIKEYGWIKEEDFFRGLALCQLIPGATVVQMVTYIEYRLHNLGRCFLCDRIRPAGISCPPPSFDHLFQISVFMVYSGPF